MDAVAGLLDGPRARGAFLLRSSLTAPWSLRIADEAPLTLVAVVRGDAWVAHNDAEPVRIGPDDVAIILGPDHYTVADDPSRPPEAVIHPGGRCTTPDGGELEAMSYLGVRSWGNARSPGGPPGAGDAGGAQGAGPTEMLTGTYQLDGEVSRRLLRALPRMLVMRGDDWRCPFVALLADEIVKDEPGQEAVLDRLLDLLLIATLRAWFVRPEARAPGWYRAYGDPVIGQALRLLHEETAHPWTIAELARATGVSRAAFARRFNELVGEPPMTFLTGWRIALAADLLREPGANLGAVAHEVGYGSPFALSTAFKRVRGISPQQYRAAAALAG